jgi:hypothetical protein
MTGGGKQAPRGFGEDEQEAIHPSLRFLQQIHGENH